MIISLNQANNPQKVLSLRDWARIIIQPLGNNPVRISTNQIEAGTAIGAANDGLQINPSLNNTDIFQIWWRGALWLVAVNANTQCILLIPGFEREVI